MKSLSLTKPLVLVVIGHPGAGKSFFARQFSDTFSAPRVNVDSVYHLIKTSDLDNSKQAIATSISIVDQQITELLKSQKTFIVDGIGATRAERLSLKKRASAAGYDMLLVWVQTDGATSKYRAVNRKQEDQEAMSIEDYARSLKRFTAPQINERHVVVSGKHTYATQAKVVLKKLVQPREEDAKNRSILNHTGRTPTSPSSTQVSESPRRDIVIR